MSYPETFEEYFDAKYVEEEVMDTKYPVLSFVNEVDSHDPHKAHTIAKTLNKDGSVGHKVRYWKNDDGAVRKGAFSPDYGPGTLRSLFAKAIAAGIIC